MGIRQLSWAILALVVAALAACGGGSTRTGDVKEPVDKTEAGDDDAEPEIKAKPGKEEDDGDDEPEVSFSEGKFTWFELFTSDPAKAARFYSDLLGWETTAADLGGMKVHLIKNKGLEIGLIADAAKSPMPKQWVVYISVPDVDEAVLDAKANGGKVVTPAVDVKTVGVRFAVVADPDGAVFGVARRESGDPPDRQVTSGDWYWPQLMSTDPDDVYNFYSAVAGYTRNELTVGKIAYTRLVGDELCRGVITKADKGFRPLWIPWAIVDSVDDAAAKAKKLGGKVIKAPWSVDTIGRIALLRDPTGGTFGVVAPIAGESPPSPPGEDDDQ